MTEEKKAALAAIEARKGLVCDVADHIWEYAELSLQEFKSAALYCEVLEKEGFRVEKCKFCYAVNRGLPECIRPCAPIC